jgi:hypothetical protein
LVLKWLDEGKIILNGETDDIGHYHYIDKRTEAEKKLRTVETIEEKEYKIALLTTSAISRRMDRDKGNKSTFYKLWSRLMGK